MRKAEVEAVGELAGDALATTGTLDLRDMHEGIAGRPFGILGPAAAPVRVVHDGISRAVYRGVGGALRGAARGTGPPLASGARSDAAAFVERVRGIESASRFEWPAGTTSRRAAMPSLWTWRSGETAPVSRTILRPWPAPSRRDIANRRIRSRSLQRPDPSLACSSLQTSTCPRAHLRPTTPR